MVDRPRLVRFLVLVSVVAILSPVSAWSRAGIILAIAPAGFQPGVIACLGMNGDCVYTPTTDNPAKAFNGGIEAALSQNGTFIRMAFTLQDTSGQSQYASTAATPTFANPIGISIVGTAGEPVGTPVLLRLSTGTIAIAGNTQMIFQVLTVQGVGIPVAAPGTLALLIIGGLVLGTVSPRRQPSRGMRAIRR